MARKPKDLPKTEYVVLEREKMKMSTEQRLELLEEAERRHGLCLELLMKWVMDVLKSKGKKSK
jgi:hypothetical protein